MTGKEVHLLLVEDNEVDVKAIRRALKKTKIANPLHVAKDGVEALEKLRAGTIPNPRVVLMDLNLPRMDGLTCLKEIRADKDLRKTIVFILTTSKDQQDKIKAYNHNVAGYIIKSEVGGGFVKALQMLYSYWNVVEFPD